MRKHKIFLCVFLLQFMFCVCACDNEYECTIKRNSNAIESCSLENAEILDVSFVSLDGELIESNMKNRVEKSLNELIKIVPISDIRIGIGRRENYSENLICFTKEEIYDDAFEDELIEKVTDLVYWKRIGLREYVYGYTPFYSEDEVREYILCSESDYFASMFPLFFYEEFADTKSCNMSRDFAYYVTEYVLERYTYEEYAQKDYRIEWITETGIDYAIDYDDIDGIVQKSEVFREQDCFKLTCGINTWEIGDVEWLKTADQVYEVLYESEAAIEKFSKNIAEKSNKYSEDDFIKSVKIITSDERKNSEACNYEIVLTQPSSFLHEYVHCVLNYSTSEAWLIEGIAEYYALAFECSFYSWSDYYKRVFDQGLLTETEKKEYEEGGFIEYVESSIEIYQKLRQLIGDDTNQVYCMKIAMGISDLMYFETQVAKNVNVTNIQDADIRVIRNERLGNQLSYDAAMIITSSLIDKYGVDSIVDSSNSFEKDFGITSDKYITDYIANKEYLAILGVDSNENY